MKAWTGVLLALAAGVAAALAQPPFGVMPGLSGYGLLLYVLDATPVARPWRAAFFRGWMAGFGYLLVSVWWIAKAFLVDAATRGWQGPFAVALTAGGIGLFWGGAGLVYKWLAPRTVGSAFRILISPPCSPCSSGCVATSVRLPLGPARRNVARGIRRSRRPRRWWGRMV